jgi:hypothetical protein
VGAGGVIMARSLEMICNCISVLLKTDANMTKRIRIRLFGTYAFWKEGDARPMAETIARFGLEEVIEELPARVGYTKAMSLVQRADGLLVLGVDDAGYMPSKLFTYALTGKPLLACLRSDSPANAFFRQIPALGHLVVFGQTGEPASAESVEVARAFMREVAAATVHDRKAQIAEYLSEAMARRHAALFEYICAQRV